VQRAANAATSPFAIAPSSDVERVGVQLDHGARLALIEGSDAREAHLDKIDRGELITRKQT
jgi:hypothetical protein